MVGIDDAEDYRVFPFFLCFFCGRTGYLRPVFGPLRFPTARQVSFRRVGRLVDSVTGGDAVVLPDRRLDSAVGGDSNPSSFLSCPGSCWLRTCCAVACLCAIVLLRKSRGQS